MYDIDKTIGVLIKLVDHYHAFNFHVKYGKDESATLVITNRTDSLDNIFELFVAPEYAELKHVKSKRPITYERKGLETPQISLKTLQTYCENHYFQNR